MGTSTGLFLSNLGLFDLIGLIISKFDRVNKKDKIQYILDTLEKLYPDPDISLKHRSAYTLLVAVVLSAQCTDERVNQVTPKLFKKAATPLKMSRLTQEEILDIIRPCGLGPAKSKAILELSRILVEEYGGKIPTSLEELEKLPGVGHKTASVMMIQAFNRPAFPVDTHIHRLLYRWGISSGKNVTVTERDAKRVFPQDRWIKLHLQIILFGRKYCPARGHDVSECPICRVVGRKSLAS